MSDVDGEGQDRSPVVDELRGVFAALALRRVCVAAVIIGVLAPLANVASLTVHASARETANAFTSINAGVFLALLLGVLGTTGSVALPPRVGPAYRRAVGAKARAYGLIGAVSVLLLGFEAAVVALPIIHARGLTPPSSPVVEAYFQREIIAGARLALLGTAIGILVIRRWLAVATLFGFMVVEAVAEARIPFVRDYGPIGALNAFSDPSHHHQLSVGAGGAIALGWTLAALLIATLISEQRSLRARTLSAVDASPVYQAPSS